MFKKCLVNRITRKDGDYKCYLCHNVMKQCQFNVVEEHLLSDSHREKLNQIDKEKRKIELDKLLDITGPQRKKIVENLITFDKVSLFLDCHVCKCKISGLSNVLQHIDGNLHKNNWKSLTTQNNNDMEQISKKISHNNIIANEIIAAAKNVTTKASISVLQPGSNGITYNEHSNSHYCNICKIKIIASPNISQHTQGLLHKALESKLEAQNSSRKSDYIIYDEKCNLYHCTICKLNIDSNPNVTQHIQGFLHQTMLEAGKIKSVETVKKVKFDDQITLMTQKGHRTNKDDKKIQIEGVLEQIDYKSYFTEIFYCKTCQVFIDKSTILKCHVLLHLYEEFKSLKNLDLIKFKLKSNNKLYLQCLLCNCYVCEYISNADHKLEQHFNTDVHMKRLQLFNVGIKKYPPIPTTTQVKNSQINDISLKSGKYNPKRSISIEQMCIVCNVPVPLKSIKEHVHGKSHNKKASENTISDKKIVKKSDFNLNLDYYSCFMCNKSFSESSEFLEHFETLEHRWKFMSLNMINNCSYMKYTEIQKGREVIQCSTCNSIMYTFKSAVDHMIGKYHNEELKFSSNHLKNSNSKLPAQIAHEFEKLTVTRKNIPCELGNNANKNVPIIKAKSVKKIKEATIFEATSIEELNKLGFSKENIEPLPLLKPNMADKLLGNLICPDFNESQIRKLPSNAKAKLPRTPKIEDQRNSFAANVLLNGKTYVKFCIDLGQDNIFNFNDEKINLLKLGVTLTFPYHSGRLCIPCGQKFPSDVQSLFEHLQNQEHLQNICNMQVDDKEFEKFPEQFSDLQLAKFYMHVLDKSIQCHACNIEVDDNDDIIRQHVKTSTHKERSKLWKEESEQLLDQFLCIYKDIWFYAEVFFCEICKKRFEFEIDFAIHLIHPEHMKKVYELKHKGTVLEFDLCPPCTTYWFGKADSYEVHCKDNFHKRFAKNKDLMVPDLTITASEYLDNIDDNIDFLVSESDKVDLGKDKVTALMKAILEAVKPTYSDAKAYVFGSRLSHLGFPDSDVDVFLDCQNVYYKSSTKIQNQQCIRSVKSYFENAPNAWKVDEVLIPTRVPILKLRHLPTNLKCDISFVNGLSVEKSQLLGLYNRAFPICRKLILFMKKWLTLCRIFGSDYITTFAISWSVIFYLQLQGILPPVYELIKRKMESKIVDGWECGYGDIITVESTNLSLKEHLKGFFTYFANFDYQKSVVCPYLGKTIDKHTFAYSDKLPPEMDIYKRRLKDCEVEIFRFDSPMCIQDPIDLSQNLTKAVNKKYLRCFRQYCILSAEKC